MGEGWGGGGRLHNHSDAQIMSAVWVYPVGDTGCMGISGSISLDDAHTALVISS